jgi:alpha-D-ribose 1-methylphosphonate 5-phosphate C-P lyase
MPHCKLQPDGSLHKRTEAIAEMSMSKPIPIPMREEDSHNDEIMTTQAAEIYDAATWRMFELISSARLRAASNFHLKVLVDDHPSSRHVVLTQDDHNAVATSSSQQQQLEATRRDRVYSLPEPPSAVPPPNSSLMDAMFPMDSL